MRCVAGNSHGLTLEFHPFRSEHSQQTFSQPSSSQQWTLSKEGYFSHSLSHRISRPRLIHLIVIIPLVNQSLIPTFLILFPPLSHYHYPLFSAHLLTTDPHTALFPTLLSPLWNWQRLLRMLKYNKYLCRRARYLAQKTCVFLCCGEYCFWDHGSDSGCGGGELDGRVWIDMSDIDPRRGIFWRRWWTFQGVAGYIFCIDILYRGDGMWTRDIGIR